MEALYAKLHERFLKLKKAKESKNEKRDHDQEVKLLEFAAAADEMLLYMTSENDELKRQVDELKSELITVRSSSGEKLIHYQKRLTVEEQKNKELCEEIARLQKLEHNQCSPCIAPGETGWNQEKSRDDTSPEEMSGKTVRNSKNKKRKSVLTIEGTASATTHLVDEGPDRTSDQHVYGEKNTQQPICCRNKIIGSGDDAGSLGADCMLQSLVECVVGMKMSVSIQNNELCIVARHQSSELFFQSDMDNELGRRSRIAIPRVIVGNIRENCARVDEGNNHVPHKHVPYVL
ncbi:hypothetical protein OROMI_002922 [Orobanche minor]